MKKLFWILFLFFSCYVAHASHMVSGYLSFKCLGGYTYQITLYNWANFCNDAYDQDTITIFFGDGDHAVMVRQNGPVVNGFHEGDTVCTCRKYCIYSATHTYPGPNTYRIHIDDPARMAGITNMFNSSAQDFFVYTTINLNSFTGDSLTCPVITTPLACAYACHGHCYYFNLGAYSPSGDSLSYLLGNCLGGGGSTAAGYYIPSGTTIDAATGTLQWCSPPAGGIYNFAIDVVSYKKVIAGHTTRVYPVDTVECDLEILVDTNCTNDPPVVTGPTDTCIVAGDLLKLQYTATDADKDLIDVVATGQPFSASPPATYTSTSPGDPVKLNFSWSTTCSDVRKSPYPLLITATDIPPKTSYPPLTAYQNTNIYVVGPAPTGLVAIPIGNTDSLHWNPSICPQVTGYSIYRHTGCFKWIHDACTTGVPASSGYVLIGTTTGIDDTTFLDNNGGKGLVPGISYDYMVVANYPVSDGSQSYASKDTCVTIKKDVPVIINVSVDTTHPAKGKIFVRWVKPAPDTLNLDTLKNPGPYKYVLSHAVGINGTSFSPVVTYTSPFYKSPVDTTFMDTLLNTLGTGYNYKLDFYTGSTSFKGSSTTASSIYLSIKPDNNKLHLSWQSNVPWTDSTYFVYRKDPPPASTFNLIATLSGSVHTYTDTGLTNRKTFCYYVKSKSAYSDTSIYHPLFDSSEVMCAEPKDTIPPCSPKLSVTAKCDTYVDSLVWNNPDYFCPKTNDILYYKIYFSPLAGNELQLIDTIANLKDTLFIHDSLNSIAGCFAVTAVDSFGNESPLDTICVDNCPEYVLPNIFTPNGDGQNDVFTPLIPYRYIKDIDISIFNRWGEVVFNTIDPKINWDGRDQNTHGLCPDGVYYYVCQVHEIHVTGIKTVTLHGFVQIIR